MKHPPYHLRSNKSVDRLMLVDVISKLSRKLNLGEYTYFGLGGPFLDDVRILSQHFPSLKFVSVEKNFETHKRQRFHQNTKNLTLIRNDINSYLRQDFQSGLKSIFWLDYTDLKPERFEEFMEVLQIVGSMSVVKITLRAQQDNPTLDSVGDLLNDAMRKMICDARFQDFERRFGDYLPEPVSGADLQSPKFVSTVQAMVRIASQKALPVSTGTVFQILHACRYADGPEMLSITGIVCEKESCTEIVKLFQKWPALNMDWHPPDQIDVPDLTVKERLFLEPHLPVVHGTGKGLQRKLGYKIDRSGAASERKLRQYEQFYSYYPQFVKVSV